MGWQFGRPGLVSGAAPFALVAVVAALSVLVPDGDVPSWPEYVSSVVLLFLCAGTFLLPWRRLPAWTPVLVPLIWSVLFHRRWAPAYVVVAVVTVQLVSSVAQAVPGDVVLRRVLLWSALSGLITVAAHGLRDRIAADLGESIVRRIFEAGLDLHGTAAMIGEGSAQRRLMRGVAELDAVIRALRESVFDVSDEVDAATDACAAEGPGPDGR
ncbi:hypothetical protein QFZ75_000215 [Streptomyces sp. V3I8]|uniref:hypothetical protein n=1 Tax=Streptomyces sp. V3I8 TaxID=3042279 RepID=UPI00278618DF|nr:hypothetical protein [Streptomyces sp. V3I8]MDQ1033799.1 hypothetical protein [Streptomyces sp. V3I8]